jgi:hypothetical protein
MLLKVIKTKRNHRKLPLGPKKMAGVPTEATPARMTHPSEFGDQIHAPCKNLERDRTQKRIRLGWSCSLLSCPPKRLFGLIGDVAPGKPDVMQVALGQFGQLAPLKLARPPHVQRLAELCEQAGTMMIYHRFV